MNWQTRYALPEIEQVVSHLKAWGTGMSRWLLYGPLGSGKTTLVRTWIGLEAQSPTFTYINAYARSTYHIDLFRFRDTDYARWEAVYEILETAPLVFVEWAEKLPWPVSLPYVEVHIQPIGPELRQLTARKITANYQ